ELTTMNDEVRQRAAELDRVNTFLENILTSLRGAVVVVDPSLNVLIWNRRAEDMWGLREDEVLGKHFLSLDSGLPVEQLKHPVKVTIGGAPGPIELELDATNRRGRPIRCHVSIAPLRTSAAEVRGAIVIMEESVA